jgi:hypothetical protein
MEFEIISRRAAADSGKRFFYTGNPCKRGHLAQRYTINGCCTACQNISFKPRQNPITKDLTSFVPSKLWAPKSYGRDDLIRLRHYLQSCIYAHAKAKGALTPQMVVAWNMHEERKPQVDDPNEVP